jgi:hypothetical protein
MSKIMSRHIRQTLGPTLGNGVATGAPPATPQTVARFLRPAFSEPHYDGADHEMQSDWMSSVVGLTDENHDVPIERWPGERVGHHVWRGQPST